MTTFTAWRFDDTEGADHAYAALRGAADDGLITVLDHAVVTWPQDASKPTVQHGHEDQWRGTGWGAFWGLLFGGLFFVPLLGAAAGAAIGGISRTLNAVGLTEDQLKNLREQVTPGTSMLCAVTEEGNTDRVAERFHGLHSTLVATNLTDAERSALLEAFG
ncbi:DUF1269 domain-containing protein [Cellulomonas sp. DKR-3]|uniref:DUF1269 domain-containing protein n=1 Tax=Cellulomonas fulva TaxID=2835530 RepID=A0ABS5TVM0_9CELL|nr:DUF1269 domain-containing protein [Cellulomonas fulva]MBT0993183.1 DUF1269 domain-containing protein [Cellulomonas fulva]